MWAPTPSMDGSRSTARAAISKMPAPHGIGPSLGQIGKDPPRPLDADSLDDLEAARRDLVLQVLRPMEEGCREVVARGRVAMLAAAQILLDDAHCRRILKQTLEQPVEQRGEP